MTNTIIGFVTSNLSLVIKKSDLTAGRFDFFLYLCTEIYRSAKKAFINKDKVKNTFIHKNNGTNKGG